MTRERIEGLNRDPSANHCPSVNSRSPSNVLLNDLIAKPAVDAWSSAAFNICWGGVCTCTRAFLPMLQNAEESHIVNTATTTD